MPQRQRAAYMKEWRANNKEKIVATSKEYCANNKEEMAAYHKEWCQTLAGIKSRIITVWKRYGITPPEGYTIHELYDEIYMKSSERDSSRGNILLSQFVGQVVKH